MTVSRRGKRGNRAGTMRPSSRNGRVRQNARSKKNIGSPSQKPKSKITRDGWVLIIAADALGTGSADGLLHKEDVLSEVLVRLLDAGGFSWEEEEIREYCKNQARKMWFRHKFRPERPESEFETEETEGWHRARGISLPFQEISFMANESIHILSNLPSSHREALETLADGGNPVEVAEEQGISVSEAIRLIKEARSYVSRVDAN